NTPVDESQCGLSAKPSFLAAIAIRTASKRLPSFLDDESIVATKATVFSVASWCKRSGELLVVPYGGMFIVGGCFARAAVEAASSLVSVSVTVIDVGRNAFTRMVTGTAFGSETGCAVMVN